MPSNRKKARRALKDFVQGTAGELPNADPADQYVRTSTGKLFLNDIRTLLRSERAARAEAVRLQGVHKDAEVLERLAASVPDLRRLVEERGRKIRELTAERDALQRKLERAERDTVPPFVSEPGRLNAEDLRKIAEDLLPQILAAFLPKDKK